jgi:hypothetical protein
MATRDILVDIDRNASRDNVGVAIKMIDAGLILIASTESEGTAIKLSVAGEILVTLTEKVGVIDSETAPASPPIKKDEVGLMISDRVAGVIRSALTEIVGNIVSGTVTK